MDTHTKPLLGFRRWKLNLFDQEHPALVPATTAGGTDWKPGLNRAVCKADWTDPRCSREEVPGERCHCGFNAWFRLKDAQKFYTDALIVGAVAGAGQTRIHTKGFRSSEAQVVAFLIDPKTNWDIAVALGRNYGVPIFSEEKDFIDYVDSLGFCRRKEALGNQRLGLGIKNVLVAAKDMFTLIGPIAVLNTLFLCIFCLIPGLNVLNMIPFSILSAVGGIYFGAVILDALRERKLINPSLHYMGLTFFCFIAGLVLSNLLVFYLFGLI